MTRDMIIDALVEGFIKDVLTYDLGKHHPRPHDRHKLKATKKGYGEPIGKHNPKTFHPEKVSRASVPVPVPKGYHHQTKTSTARRPGPSTQERRGRKVVLGTAAAVGAGITAHKLYKQRQRRKKEMREGDLGDFAVAPTAAVDASPSHKEQRDRFWEIKNRKRIKNMRVEVFDDTYGKAVLKAVKKKGDASDLIRKARALKAARRVPSSLFSHAPMKISRKYRGLG